MARAIQLQLFEQPTLNISTAQKEAMSQAAKNCGLSRQEIVDHMNRLASQYGVRLAKGNSGGLQMATFEKWLNPEEHGRDIPVRALPIFCAVTSDCEALDIMARPLSCRVIGREDVRLLKWAKAYFRQRAARSEMRKLEAEL